MWTQGRGCESSCSWDGLCPMVCQHLSGFGIPHTPGSHFHQSPECWPTSAQLAEHMALICLKEVHSKGKLPHVVQCLSTIPQQCHWEKGAFVGVRREPLLEVLGITPCPCWPAIICVTPLSPSPSLCRDEVGSRGTGLEHLWDWFQCRMLRILASHVSAQSWAPLTLGTDAFPAASWDVLCGRRGGNLVFLTVVMSSSGRGGFPLAIRPGTSPFRFIGEYEKKM